MKRYLVLIVFLLTVMSFLAGCGVASPQTDSDIGKPAHQAADISSQSETGQVGAQPNDSSVEKLISTNSVGKVAVHFVDVGQGDCILVQLPENKIMLIDAGNNEDGRLVVDYLNGCGVKKVDFLVGTHPHEDHIGGLDDVIRSFEVGRIIMPKVAHSTRTFEDVMLAVKDKGLKITPARSGLTIWQTPDVKVEVLAPIGTQYESLNDFSAVIKLTYDETSFLFTGDAGSASEKEMRLAGLDLKTDVLKVGHHGSSSSTSRPFLQEADPGIAVICCGAGNDYGHPHHETLSLLQKSGIRIFRTDLNGTVLIESDGNSLEIGAK